VVELVDKVKQTTDPFSRTKLPSTLRMTPDGQFKGTAMAIDYYGSFACSVREAVSDVELLRMEKARNRARTVLETMRNNPQVDKRTPESEWTFKTVVLSPDGPEQSTMRIADLLADAAPLESLANNCAVCPFNVRSTDFGCGGAIHYPITEQAERWLLSRLPDDLNSQSGKLLLRAISDFGYDGVRIDASRHRKELYECEKPLVRKWGGILQRKTRITSSQILHMAFDVGNLQAAHAKLIAHFVGFVGNDFEISKRATDAPEPSDDSRTVELKIFFAVAALAGTSNTGMHIDA
jgi:hypothetical protein